MQIARDLPRRIHCVGIRGGGLSALAGLLAARGHEVTGSDVHDGPSLGVPVAVGHDARHVGGAGLVIRSAAVPVDNPELAAARAAGLPVLKYSEALGRVMADRRGIAVAGTHGKTTTTALIAHLLRAVGAEPSWIVGGRPLGLPASSAWGRGELMVTEACEYDLSFLNLDYEIAVVTGIARDHLDCFGDEAGVRDAFRRFAARIPPGGRLVTGVGVPADMAWTLAGDVRVGCEVDVVDVVEGPQGYGGTLDAGAGGRAPFRLSLLGAHNLDNLRVAVAAVLAAGRELVDVAPHAATFGGVERRLQDLGERPCPAGGTARLVDDFAHHPEALRAALAAVRSRYPGRRVVAVFQPHQVSRTADFLGDFAAVLRCFDAVALCDIFVARDAQPERAEALVGALAEQGGDGVRRVGPAAAAVDAVAGMLRPDDVCLVMGAGDVDQLAARLVGAARP